MNIFTQNPDFYPTPADVIEQMMTDEFVAGKTILEPSAGKGNIVDWLLAHGAKEVIACESDKNLRAIVSQKCDVIADDFMKVNREDVAHVDYIVMNPPFFNGVQHIMHAWEIAPAGCTIVALCNSSSVQGGCHNRNTAVFLETIELHGWAEHLGSCFVKSERDTDVDVSLVKLYKPGIGESEFDGYVFDGTPDLMGEGGATAGVITYDFIRDIVTRYCRACSTFDSVKRLSDELNALASFPGEAGAHAPIEFRAVSFGRERDFTVVSHDRYKKELQKYYWRVIFNKMDLEKYATRQLREQINKFVERNTNTPFTMKNIYKVISIVYQTTGQRMQNALCEAFDTICGFSAENSTAGEKWKTNSDYMVNRKFIVPWIADGYDFMNTPRRHVEIHYEGNSELMNDITKALCHLTGRNYDSVGRLRDHVRKTKPDWGTWFEWGFFRCKAFKKGTVHFEFIDEDVWAKFNQAVASSRGWTLPRYAEKKRKTA